MTMTAAKHGPRVTSVLGYLALLVCATVSLAQAPAAPSDNDLRVENERLKQRIEVLEKQLSDSKKRIKQLTDTLLKHAGEKGAGGTGGSKPEGGTPESDYAPAPEDPLASPPSMFRALAAAFEQDLANVPRETKPEQAKYLAQARKWAQQKGREVNGRAVWTIRVVSVAEKGRQREVTCDVVEPASGKAYGPPVTIAMKAADATKLEGAAPDSLWKLTGTLSAAPKVNPDKEKPGAFDAEGTMVGSFIEFGFEFIVQDVDAVPAPPKP